MSNLKNKRNDRSSAGYRPLMIAALFASGILQPLLPVLAAGTAAGQNISNTATATYDDDDVTTPTFNATSNTVQIIVAPVSGVTVKPTGINDVNTGAVEQGDTLEYNFDVKNVGNTAAGIFIPVPTVTNFAVDKVEYLDDFSTPARVTTPVLVTVNAAGGIITGVASDKVVKVIVTGKVPTTGVVAGDLITVRLGNTGSNDNGSTTQNVVETDNASTSDVRTAFTSLDPQGITNPVDNKEASATQSIPFATKVTPQAFSLLKKTISSVTPGTSPAGNDDTINYKLNFSVLNSSPNGALSPAALEGTKIKVGVSAAAATETTKILVSDAIPAGTVLKAVPTSPSTDWKPVYSTDSVDTTIPIISSNASALPAASWSTTNPSTPAEFAAVKRVGFIYDPSTPIAAGATPVDFFISVVTSGLPVNGGKVYNIAQSFGETVGDTANKVVVDESGDASPSNFEDTGNPSPAYDPAKDTGKADPAPQGVDTKGDNSGVGTKGEDTEVTITGTIAPANDSIFNGPNGKPDAVGPTDANDDFTNASTSVPPGQSPSVNIVGTQLATFTNSVSNPSTVTLADVTIQPLSPTQADKADNGTADNKGQYGTDLDIPLLTEVKVTELLADGITPGTKTATYVYTLTGTVYTFEPKVIGTAPVNFGSLAPNATVKYKTEVTLPDGSVKPLTAVAIPMVAFPDDNPTGVNAGYTNELTNNITLDRVYTGYMKLVKEARILSADKNTIIEDWTVGTSGLLTKKAAPGQYIEYRISYQNISTAANGSGNVILNAKNFKLIEDGTAAIGSPASSTNNWGTFTLHQQNTLASQGTVNYFSGTGSLVGTTDQADGNDVGKYENIVPTVAPAGQGTFQFRRVVK